MRVSSVVSGLVPHRAGTYTPSARTFAPPPRSPPVPQVPSSERRPAARRTATTGRGHAPSAAPPPRRQRKASIPRRSPTQRGRRSAGVTARSRRGLAATGFPPKSLILPPASLVVPAFRAPENPEAQALRLSTRVSSQLNCGPHGRPAAKFGTGERAPGTIKPGSLKSRRRRFAGVAAPPARRSCPAPLEPAPCPSFGRNSRRGRSHRAAPGLLPGGTGPPAAPPPHV
ncbi:MAG: hypothetical protein FLDDKLPJ_01461 [Phycisphaerae bacterium]|nr:hypothetical protein [Phycisphaerae bacterium]